jgi:hypothetical protein
MHSTFKFLLVPVLAACALSGCASRTASRMGTAATAPLSDLGIRKTEVPPVLEKAQQNPYLMPAGQSCVAIAQELHDLDAALGPDYDAQASAAKHEESFMDKASDVAEDQAVGAVQRTAEGLLPFRSWIRKLSGAERHSKHVSACVTAGSVRRAFLKGLAVSQHCTLPEIPAAAAQKS